MCNCGEISVLRLCHMQMMTPRLLLYVASKLFDFCVQLLSRPTVHALCVICFSYANGRSYANVIQCFCTEHMPNQYDQSTVACICCHCQLRGPVAKNVNTAGQVAMTMKEWQRYFGYQGCILIIRASMSDDAVVLLDVCLYPDAT